MLRETATAGGAQPAAPGLCMQCNTWFPCARPRTRAGFTGFNAFCGQQQPGDLLHRI